MGTLLLNIAEDKSAFLEVEVLGVTCDWTVDDETTVGFAAVYKNFFLEQSSRHDSWWMRSSNVES